MRVGAGAYANSIPAEPPHLLYEKPGVRTDISDVPSVLPTLLVEHPTSAGYQSVMARTLLTVGYGTANRAGLATLFRDAGVTQLVDVRRYPGSRAHPHVRRQALAQWLPAEGIDYRWEERLGGRRRPPAESADPWWQVAAFRGYAQHMRSAEFLAAMDQLLTQPMSATTSVMCSEALWWRCHRRLIADFATLARGTQVRHLNHNGRITDHPVAAGARLSGNGLLFYDLTVAPESEHPGLCTDCNLDRPAP